MRTRELTESERWTVLNALDAYRRTQQEIKAIDPSLAGAADRAEAECGLLYAAIEAADVVQLLCWSRRGW